MSHQSLEAEVNKLIKQRDELMDAFKKYMDTSEAKAFANMDHLLATYNLIKDDIKAGQKELF